MLQLGLLRVITWPGSWFKKQRIKAQDLFVPTLSLWCPSVLCSVNRAFRIPFELWSIVLDVLVMVQILKVYLKKAVILYSFFLPRICSNLFFGFTIHVFFLNCFFLWLQLAGCHNVCFLSLLHRLWVNGLLFREIMTACLDDYREPSPSSVLEGRLRCHSLCTKRQIVTDVPLN